MLNKAKQNMYEVQYLVTFILMTDISLSSFKQNTDMKYEVKNEDERCAEEEGYQSIMQKNASLLR